MSESPSPFLLYKDIPSSAFAIGEIVYLKSGGPKLTVAAGTFVAIDETPPADWVEVHWFEGEIFRREFLHKDTLQR